MTPTLPFFLRRKSMAWFEKSPPALRQLWLTCGHRKRASRTSRLSFVYPADVEQIVSSLKMATVFLPCGSSLMKGFQVTFVLLMRMEKKERRDNSKEENINAWRGRVNQVLGIFSVECYYFLSFFMFLRIFLPFSHVLSLRPYFLRRVYVNFAQLTSPRRENPAAKKARPRASAHRPHLTHFPRLNTSRIFLYSENTGSDFCTGHRARVFCGVCWPLDPETSGEH